MDEAVLRELERFLEEKSPESFLRLREAVAVSRGYVPYAGGPADAHVYLGQGDYSQAKATLLSLMPSYFLNPGIHTLMSFVFHKLGDEGAARVEFELGARCLDGILSTGRGDRAHPYLVLHTDDEYDVLEHQSRKSRLQVLVADGNRAYDQHQCEDGAEVWFDITIPHSILARRFTKKS